MGVEKDAVKRANPIEAVIAELLHQEPRVAGRELAFSCPWHEDRRPSLQVNPTKNGGVYRCRSCSDVDGDVFTFVERYLGLAFKDALRGLRIGPASRTATGAWTTHRRP